MPKFEQLQHRKSRSREESVSGTFPEGYQRLHGGNPGSDPDELLEEISFVLADHEHSLEHEHDHDVARRHLGHLGLEAKKPE